MNVVSGDIYNAYLNAKLLEKCHVTIKGDFTFEPSNVNKTTIFARALYEMKISVNTWRQHVVIILGKKIKIQTMLHR